MCRLTFELTRPERWAGLPVRRSIDSERLAGKLARRGGSRVERGVRRSLTEGTAATNSAHSQGASLLGSPDGGGKALRARSYVLGRQRAVAAIWANSVRFRSCPQTAMACQLRHGVRRCVRSGDSHWRTEKPAPNVRANATPAD